MVFVCPRLLLIPKMALPAAGLLSLPQLNCVCLDAKLFKERWCHMASLPWESFLCCFFESVSDFRSNSLTWKRYRTDFAFFFLFFLKRNVWGCADRDCWMLLVQPYTVYKDTKALGLGSEGNCHWDALAGTQFACWYFARVPFLCWIIHFRKEAPHLLKLAMFTYWQIKLN